MVVYNQSQKIKIKPIHLIVLAFTLIFIVLAVISLQSVLHRNPYGPELKIDNFSKFYKKVPDDTRDSIFHSLYSTAELNLTENQTPPVSGAIIRENSASEILFDKETDIYHIDFIVDLETIHQSFRISAEWSTVKNNVNLTGYANTVTCLTGQLSAYHSTYCKDLFTSTDPNINAVEKSTIVLSLPITVSEYNANYTKYINYTITYSTFNGKIILHINDYTGGNYDDAMTRLKKIDPNVESYEIKYYDKSQQNTPSRVPGTTF